jgi:drug/metabolite transporter (DMT)-like permease
MAWLLVAVMVICTVASDLLQSFEMRRSGEVRDFGARGVGRLFRMIFEKKFLILSVACLAASFFAFVTLLSFADLSFAVPATAATVVIETILARFLLRERVDSRRWLGVVLVALGVGLLAV